MATAKKETTKKTTKKATSKKATPKEVIEEVATSIIENTEVEKAEVRQEILDKIKFDEAVLENLKKEDEIKKQEPIMETCSEPEYTPTVEEVDKAIEGFETMNGDPNVLTPIEEPKVVDLTDKTFDEAKKVLGNAEQMTIYKANKEVIEAVVKEKTSIEEINEKAFKDTFKELNNNKRTRLDSAFGYSWNGMEMDY